MRVSDTIVKATSPSMLFIASQCLHAAIKMTLKSPKVHSAAEPEESKKEKTQQRSLHPM